MKTTAWTRFWRLSSREKQLFFRAMRVLMLCRIYYWIQPYHRLEQKFKKSKAATGHDETMAYLIRDALRRAGKWSLWKNKCLVQTLAARRLLNHYEIDSSAFLGVQKETKTKDFAHAWIIASGVEVVPSIAEYVQMHEF